MNELTKMTIDAAKAIYANKNNMSVDQFYASVMNPETLCIFKHPLAIAAMEQCAEELEVRLQDKNDSLWTMKYTNDEVYLPSLSWEGNYNEIMIIDSEGYTLASLDSFDTPAVIGHQVECDEFGEITDNEDEFMRGQVTMIMNEMIEAISDEVKHWVIIYDHVNDYFTSVDANYQFELMMLNKTAETDPRSAIVALLNLVENYEDPHDYIAKKLTSYYYEYCEYA